MRAGQGTLPHRGISPRQWRRWLPVCIVSLGVAAGPLDTAVNIAFPAMTMAFGIPVTAIQWVVICYVLTYASLLLGCGRLGDVIGHRRVFLLGLYWSAGSLALCAWVHTFGWFLVCRGLQGIGIALVFSCAPALVTLSFPEAERAKALSVYTMLSAAASSLGPLLGGVLVALWGWPAVFAFRVPVVLLAAGLTVTLVRQPVMVTTRQHFDAFGAATITVTIASVLLALNYGNRLGWVSWPTLLLSSAASACFVVCLRHALQCPEPVLNLRLFTHAAFAVANLVQVLVNMASFTVLLLVPYYLLTYAQTTTAIGGVLLAMSPLGTMLTSPLGGRLLARFSSPALSLCGLILVVLGLWGISQWPLLASPVLVAATLLLHGSGMGLFQLANMDFVMGSIARHQQGVAGSLTMLTRTVGVVGGATLGSLVFGLLQPRYTTQLQAAGVGHDTLGPQAFLLAFHDTFWWAEP